MFEVKIAFQLSGAPSCSPWKRAHLDMAAIKAAPGGVSSIDAAPLGLEDFVMGWISINMPALWASDLNGVWAVSFPGPAGRSKYSDHTADKGSAPSRSGITRARSIGYPHSAGAVARRRKWDHQKTPESRCDFVSQRVEGELLMPQDCPGYSPKVASERRNGAAPPGRKVSLLGLPGVSRCSTPGYSNGIPPGCGKMARRNFAGMRVRRRAANHRNAGIPESRWSFDSQDADGEWLMLRECQEREERLRAKG